MLRASYSFLKTLRPNRLTATPVRLFSQIPDPKRNSKEEEDKLFEEEARDFGEKETKTNPGLFYAAGGALIFMMFYLQYLTKLPQTKEQAKPTVRILGEAQIGGAWTAINSKGKEVSDKDLLGSYIIYYFGFTKCPDICPASLQKLASAMELLKKRGYENIKYLFVSLDPERDTPEMISNYTKVFHQELEGLVVPLDKLDGFKKTFRLYARKVPNEESEYLLDHTTYMYLFDKNGKFVNVLGANLNNEELADIIQEHIKQIESKN
jgi:protein SCO1/2